MPQTMLVLVGLPGSGKTWVSDRLRGQGWAWVNQDTLGNRKQCESVCSQALRAGQHVVVDRVQVFALQLLLPIGECKRRAKSRPDHPTVAPTNADFVINSIAKDFQFIDADGSTEGFHGLMTVQNSADVDYAISCLLTAAAAPNSALL